MATVKPAKWVFTWLPKITADTERIVWLKWVYREWWFEKMYFEKPEYIKVNQPSKKEMK
jgi:hypothetical protein